MSDLSSRERMLERLRSALAQPALRFPPADPEPLLPEARMSVTQARGGAPELVERFRREVADLHASAEFANSPAEARLSLINRLIVWHQEDEAALKGARAATGQEKSVFAWDPEALPIEYLAESLADIGFTLVAPRSLQTAAERESVRHIRYGVTGVAAAFASTGSILVASAAGMSRSASLLPYRHIALIPLSRLYATIEAWMADFHAGELNRYVRDHANLTLITGPSKSADIEMNLTLGVHGPRHLHCLLFEDQAHDEPAADHTAVNYPSSITTKAQAT